METIVTKKCSKCGAEKPITKFSKNPGCRDGHRNQCNNCVWPKRDRKEYNREYKNKNKERILEQAREYGKRYREDNKERRQEVLRKYRDSHREELRQRSRAWIKNNPAKAALASLKRYYRKLKSFVEEVDRDLVWNRDKGLCHICQKPANQNNWHLDHIYPVVKGGEHSYKNVAVSHPRCNQKKSDRLMSEIEKERLGW